jgi:hypothetical protein
LAKDHRCDPPILGTANPLGALPAI